MSNMFDIFSPVRNREGAEALAYTGLHTPPLSMSG